MMKELRIVESLLRILEVNVRQSWFTSTEKVYDDRL